MASAPGNGGEPQDGAGAEEPDLTPDTVIRRIIDHNEAEPDEDVGVGVAVLTGHLGPSPKGEDYRRLYFDLGLKTYCDISVGDIVHREKVEHQDGVSVSKVVVAADATLRLVLEADLEASFLEGSIAATHPIHEHGSAQTDAGPQAGGGFFNSGRTCQPHCTGQNFAAPRLTPLFLSGRTCTHNW